MNAEPGAARRRTARIGAVALAAALLTSGCAAGRVAQTARQRPTIAGVNADIGAISIRNLTVESPPQGVSYPKGSVLRLVGVFVNNGTSDDSLTSITSPSFRTWGAYSTIAAGDQVAGASAQTSAAGSTAASPAPGAASTPATGTSPDTGSSSAGSSATGTGPAARTRTRSSSATATPTAASATPVTPTPTTPAAPQPSRSVQIPANGRTSYGVPDAVGSLLAQDTEVVIYPGTVVAMTLTFQHAGSVTVRVPVNITPDSAESFVPAPSGSGSD